jgi:alpha-beta hydrolase superfamily lysophospholipase
MTEFALSMLWQLFRVQDFLAALFHRKPRVSANPPREPTSDEVRGGTWDYLFTRYGRLYYRIWRADRSRPLGLVVAVHGAGAYSGHFWVLGQALAPLGFSTFALDLRGHGFSEGPRGDMSQPELTARGIFDLVRHLKNVYGESMPVFVLGESVGSDLVLIAAAHGQRLMDGLILAGTAVQPTEETTGLNMLETLRQSLGFIPTILFDSQRPSIDISQREERVCRDPRLVERAKTDPLRSNLLSVRTMVRTYYMIKTIFRYARRVRVPVLLLQGGQDFVTLPSAVYQLRDQLASSDKEVIMLPTAWHGLFFDPETSNVLRYISTWLVRQVGVAPEGGER